MPPIRQRVAVGCVRLHPEQFLVDISEQHVVVPDLLGCVSQGESLDPNGNLTLQRQLEREHLGLIVAVAPGVIDRRRIAAAACLAGVVGMRRAVVLTETVVGGSGHGVLFQTA